MVVFFIVMALFGAQREQQYNKVPMFTPTNPIATAFLSLTPEALYVADHGITINDFWQELTNVAASGPNNRTITKTAGGVGWNATGSSCVSLPGDGWVEFSTNENNLLKGAGLSADNPDTALTTIDYSFYLDGGSHQFQVIENGSAHGAGTAYSAGDIFRVKRVGTTITYYHNNTLYYTSLVASTGPLIFDSSLSDIGATIADVEFFGATTNTGPWQNITNVSVVGGLVTKNAGGGSWNAGASSSYAINGNGFVEFKMDALHNNFAGLATTDPDAAVASVNYAIYTTGAIVFVYELGVGIGPLGVGHVAGDIFRISVSGTTVTYYQNGTLIYTSLTPIPSRPLLFDISLFEVGNTIQLTAWGGSSARINLWSDLTGNGHNITQFTNNNQPLWDAKNGVAPYLLFDRTRFDRLENATAVPIGTAPYTLIAVYRWRSLVGASDYQGMFSNGTTYVDGISYIQQYGVVAIDAIYHWPADYKYPDQSPDTLLRSIIIREDGTNMLSRKSGVDNASVAQVAQVTPTGGLLVGGLKPTFTGNIDLYALAIIKRKLNDGEASIIGKIIQQHYGLCSPSVIAPTPLVGYRSDKNVFLTAGKVSRWGDQIGTNNLIQATPSRRPDYLVDGGFPILRFTAASFTYLSASVLALTGDYTVFTIKRHRSAPVRFGASWSNSGGADGMSDSNDIIGKRGLTHIGSAGLDFDTETFGVEACVWRYNHATTTASLRVNGIDRADTPLAAQVAPTGTLAIGTFGGYYTDVDFYEFWVWNRRLTDTEVNELDAYFTIRYTRFPQITDSSGNNHTGIMANMEFGDIQPDVPGGGAGYSMAFGGTNEYINMGNVLDFDSSNPFSLSCWVKLSGATGQYLISKIDAISPFTNNGWGYGLLQTSTSGGRLQFYLRSSDGGTTSFLGVRTTNAFVNDGAWHHVVATYDGSATPAGIRFYIDGSEILDKTTVINSLAAKNISNSGNFNISGYVNGGSALLTGSVDEPAVYDAVLSPSDVTAIYNGGVPGNLLGLSSAPHLKGWWRLGD